MDEMNEQQPDQYGTKETEEVIVAIDAIADAITASMDDDGRLTPGDLSNFLPPVLKVPQAIIGIADVPKELGELSDEDQARLKALFGEIIEDEDYQAAYGHLIGLSTSILNIVRKRKQS